MNSLFDKIYVINIDERIDRWDSIVKHLSDINITNYERISATKLNFTSTISKIKLAQISCFHSHLKTLRKAYDLGMEKVLILEDDCKFIDTDRLHVLNNSYDILYLGCNRKIYKDNNSLIYTSEIEHVNENIVKISECGTTHSIIYSRLFIEQVIKLYPTDECFFQKAFTLDEKYYIYDVFLNWFTQINNIHKYCVYPIMCTQIESFSDIQFCNTSYGDEIENSWL
jgi:GR25 family glycosyltransferase involved in LPS biosynthesis